MTRALAILAVLALAGCTTATVEKRGDGSYSASVTRLWSDVTLSLAAPDGSRLDYTSDAEAAAALQQAAIEALIGPRLRAGE
jgi:hypothetical protein